MTSNFDSEQPSVRVALELTTKLDEIATTSEATLVAIQYLSARLGKGADQNVHADGKGAWVGC